MTAPMEVELVYKIHLEDQWSKMWLSIYIGHDAGGALNVCKQPMAES